MQTLPATALSAARSFAEEALSPASRRAYRADYSHYAAWCETAALPPLPASPEQVASYLASMAATHGSATIERRLVTMGQAHKLAGHPWVRAHPAIHATLSGMFRLPGIPVRKAAALGASETRRIVETYEGFTGFRDRAMFLLAFAGALRRPELAAIRGADLAFDQKGLRLFLPVLQDDQEHQAPLCYQTYGGINL